MLQNIAIITNSTSGFANILLRSKLQLGFQIQAIIYVKDKPASSKEFLKKKLVKALKIGLLSTINGIRIRKYFNIHYGDLFELASKSNIPIYEIDHYYDTSILSKLNEIDIGLSLGNSYIPHRFFSAFKLGMINIHHELLPEMPGAQPIIWSFYHNRKYTGFTIHKIDHKIDHGKILIRKDFPITLYKRFWETVQNNLKTLHAESILAINEALKAFSTLESQEQSNLNYQAYTTPTFFQFIRMRINYLKWRYFD